NGIATASMLSILPAASSAIKAAPRVDASDQPQRLTGRPSTYATICVQTGDARNALPDATIVASGAMRSSARAIKAKRYATASIDARRISIGRVREVKPKIAPRALLDQPVLRSPAQKGKTVRP